MTAPAGIIPVSDDALLATCLRIRPLLRAMADGGGTPEKRAGARLALEVTADIIAAIRVRAITGHPWIAGRVVAARSGGREARCRGGHRAPNKT